ncbi:alpha/beta hydrolase-fold protein [Actinoplanes sp. NPDC051851]|uniref:alpha/beta hydrolase n=1 Tax=Actinoplanes sp. NPDC051851 TaxID=3154753 RepID=UPI00341D05CE
MRRRVLLTGGGSAILAAAMAAAAGAQARRDGPPAARPSGPPGRERVEQRFSSARGQTVDFYTAVPAGHGDGRGLPVCLILHGGTKRPADYPALGLGRFLTDAVRHGAAPFVLAGADGDRLAWQPGGRDDPQRMVHQELPAWCAERGFDTARTSAWGWSMGGSGALLLAESFPDSLRSVAAFSPAVTPGDAVFRQVAALRTVPVGLWCGTGDGLLDDVKALRTAMPVKPVAGGYAPGRHDFGYWSTQIPAAFAFLARTLSP